MIQSITTYLHTLQNGAHVKSVVSNVTQTSGQMQICVDVQLVVNVIESSKITHVLKFVRKQPVYV